MRGPRPARWPHCGSVLLRYVACGRIPPAEPWGKEGCAPCTLAQETISRAQRGRGIPEGSQLPSPSTTLSLNSSSACKLFCLDAMVTLPPSSMVMVPYRIPETQRVLGGQPPGPRQSLTLLLCPGDAPTPCRVTFIWRHKSCPQAGSYGRHLPSSLLCLGWPGLSS